MARTAPIVRGDVAAVVAWPRAHPWATKKAMQKAAALKAATKKAMKKAAALAAPAMKKKAMKAMKK